MIEENVRKLLQEIPKQNPFNENITLVAAVKMQTAEDINRAVNAGITAIGDNHVQEFRSKYDSVLPVQRHFIGHLQSNKIKYLLGRTDLYHSIDRFSIAEELSLKSLSAEIISEILIQINAGNESSKGGFSFDEAETAFTRISALPALKVRGLMAMLPCTDDEKLLRTLAKRMRALYCKLHENNDDITYLSMGMSGDWRICIEEGSNMIRLGTAIFGNRNYNKQSNASADLRKS